MSAGLYSVLGVARGASRDTVRTAYLRLAKQLHPDVNKTSAASEKFQKVQEAYEVLSDDTKRRAHDRELERQFGYSRPAAGSHRPSSGPSSSTESRGPSADSSKYAHQGAYGGPGQAPLWGMYDRARFQQEQRWRKEARQEFERRHAGQYNSGFNEDQYKRTLVISAMKMAPFLVPLWMIALLFSLRRRDQPQARQDTIFYDPDGRAWAQDAYGRQHRLYDFDRQ
eukprot:TRINITY_DN100696_c0_g1_i1.p1 TRINITY_DN100696_c0_g1~~TRINITY_DN100696_c0_g1_i1.p1  ORF type:complete len:225 (+),score=45.78 TRINITY_DN100696_c0_g1_i1:169-843(+)